MDLIIKKEIIKRRPTDIYCLHVQSTHGDADHVSVESVYLKNPEPVIKFLQAVLPLISQRKPIEEIETFAEKKAKEIFDGEDITIIGNVYLDKQEIYPIDLFFNLVSSDVTSQDCLARPEYLWLTWFNCYGSEFEVAIKLDNGEVVDKIFFPSY